MSDRLQNIVIVLERPKDLVNIGGVVRVMLNTGISRLRLIEPDDFEPRRVRGIAHRSEHLLDKVELYETVTEALADVVWVVGTSARSRAVNTNAAHPRNIAPSLLERAVDGPLAILFGREDRGLTNEGMDRCHEVVVIPTAPGYSSLNLAQACMVVCYELMLAAGGFTGEHELGQGKKARRSPPATREEIERTFGALEKGLEEIDFFKSRSATLTLRPLRSLIGRAAPTQREINLLEAIGARIAHQARWWRRGEESTGTEAEPDGPEES